MLETMVLLQSCVKALLILCGYYTYTTTQKVIEKRGYEIWLAQSYNGYGLSDNIDDILVEQDLNLLTRLKAE